MESQEVRNIIWTFIYAMQGDLKEKKNASSYKPILFFLEN